MKLASVQLKSPQTMQMNSHKSRNATMTMIMRSFAMMIFSMMKMNFKKRMKRTMISKKKKMITILNGKNKDLTMDSITLLPILTS